MPDEASKDVVVKDSYMPDGTVTAAMSERDSYMPEQKSAVNSTEKDSYMPDEKTSPAAPSAATPSEADATSIEGLTPPKGSQEATSEERTDAIVHEHGAGHVHDEVHATTPRSTEGDDDEEEEDEDEEEVDGDGVVSGSAVCFKTCCYQIAVSISNDHRKSCHFKYKHLFLSKFLYDLEP